MGMPTSYRDVPPYQAPDPRKAFYLLFGVAPPGFPLDPWDDSQFGEDPDLLDELEDLDSEAAGQDR